MRGRPASASDCRNTTGAAGAFGPAAVVPASPAAGPPPPVPPAPADPEAAGPPDAEPADVEPADVEPPDVAPADAAPGDADTGGRWVAPPRSPRPGPCTLDASPFQSDPAAAGSPRG